MSIDNKRRIENLQAIIGLSSNGVKALNKAEQWVTNNCPRSHHRANAFVRSLDAPRPS